MTDQPTTDADREEALRQVAHAIRNDATIWTDRHNHALDYLILKAADELDAQGSPPSEPILVSDGDVDWQARAEEAEDHLARLRGLLTDKAAFYKACIEVPRTPVKSISTFRAVAMVLYSILDES